MKAKGTAAEEEDVWDPDSAVLRPGKLRPSQDLAGNSDISISHLSVFPSVTKGPAESGCITENC